MKNLNEIHTEKSNQRELRPVVGVPFIIRIKNEESDPGASWFHQFDSDYLKIISSGWQPESEGNSFTWAKFVATKTGVTQIEVVRQLNLITPSFTPISYKIIITGC